MDYVVERGNRSANARVATTRPEHVFGSVQVAGLSELILQMVVFWRNPRKFSFRPLLLGDRKKLNMFTIFLMHDQGVFEAFGHPFIFLAAVVESVLLVILEGVQTSVVVCSRPCDVSHCKWWLPDCVMWLLFACQPKTFDIQGCELFVIP